LSENGAFLLTDSNLSLIDILYYNEFQQILLLDPSKNLSETEFPNLNKWLEAVELGFQQKS
jgi:hypothetical protein